jgi:hypothetical protein
VLDSDTSKNTRKSMGMDDGQAWYVRNIKAAFSALILPGTPLYALKGAEMTVFHVAKNTN